MPNINQWDAREKLRNSGIAYAAMQKVMQKVHNSSRRMLIDTKCLPQEVMQIFIKEGHIKAIDGKLSLVPGAAQKINRSYNLGSNEVLAIIDTLNTEGVYPSRSFLAEA